jgi:hypothetical protein
MLALAVAVTTLAGLSSANDLSRSATLRVPRGWLLVRSTYDWFRWRVAAGLAVTALALPAHHVVTDFTMTLRLLPSSYSRRSSPGGCCDLLAGCSSSGRMAKVVLLSSRPQRLHFQRDCLRLPS